MKFAAVLFDLDGTLLDTLADIAAATNAALADLARAPLASAVIATYVGKGTELLLSRCLAHAQNTPAGPAELARALQRYEHHYQRINGTHARLYPGVRAGLERFQASGAALAVVTNKSTQFTRPLLEQKNLAHFFAAIVCGDTCAQKKPDPAPLLHACALLGVEPQNSLFIGDSANDALAALACKMPALAVPYGYCEGRSVHELPVNAIVPDIVAAASWAAGYQSKIMD